MAAADQETFESEVDYVLKIVLIGDSNVGKTNILTRYIHNTFYEITKATIGVEFATKYVKTNEIQLRLQIWDTAGQERYRAITSSFYKGSSGALVVFDVSKRFTFDKVDIWVKELRERAGENIQIIIIGNKIDLNDLREVKEEEGIKKANNLSN